MKKIRDENSRKLHRMNLRRRGRCLKREGGIKGS